VAGDRKVRTCVAAAPKKGARIVWAPLLPSRGFSVGRWGIKPWVVVLALFCAAQRPKVCRAGRAGGMLRNDSLNQKVKMSPYQVVKDFLS
jgi:hypothetical protein